MRLAIVAVAGLLLGSAPTPAPAPEQPLSGAPAAARALHGALQLESPDERDAALARVARSHPLVADHVHRLRAARLLEAGAPERAVRAAREALAARPQTPLRARLHRLEGDALLAAGDAGGARRAWEQALAADPGAEERAEIELALAASHDRAGERRRAGEIYLRLWTRASEAEIAERAAEGLDAIESELGETLRDAEAHLARADALLRQRRTADALDAYEQALRASEGGPLRARRRTEAERGRARALFHLRRYPEAREAFAALAERDREARLWAARARARTGEVEPATEELLELAEEGGALGLRARYLAALLLEDDHPGSAREQLLRLVRAAGSSELGRAARWRLGWSAYREGRWEDARRHLEALARDEPDPILALRPRYWLARLEAERDERETAGAAFAAIVREYPFSYYGWRSRGRLRALARADGGPAGQGAGAAGARALPEAEGTTLPPGRPALPPRALARPGILLAAGLPEPAREELDHLRRRVSSRDERLELASLYSEVGEHHAAQRLVVDPWNVHLARGPAPGHEEAWWLAWPRAFDDLVRRFSREAGAPVEPALVYAVMREESGYRPEVVSIVGARGLLQIMPETGARLAQDAGLAPFDAEDLFEPRVNIRLGARYLGQLGRRFGGRDSAAIGSYNAGPTAVARWLRERPDEADDAWVESVPYAQTRAYLKRVLRSRHVYRVLY